ncbi:uncharacterized protein LOC116848424 isoform X2 [Odontomachus brunneus]|uniref:uncharacterized protein LOC116848424 isoform X2 n=1 Tax=Odontomachus brunneus TaxID=486640 RepID=UPI0013F1CA1C|nr:uncharacterized protein LOC116848424 isoform X2 [Odontomachus brunneus]
MSRGMDGDLSEFAPRPRSYLTTYMERTYHDELVKLNLAKINDPKPVITKPIGPHRRKPIRQEDSEANSCLTYGPEELSMSGVPRQRRKSDHTYKNGASSDNTSDDDKQMTNNIDEELEEERLLNHSVPKSPNHSRTTSPERLENSKKNKSLENSWKKLSTEKREKKKKLQLSSIEQNPNSFLSWNIVIVLALVVFVLHLVLSGKFDSTRENQTEPTTNNRNSFKLIQDIKSKFYSQDSHIWDEISSGINEVKMRTPKVPSIILLFANETHTMDCLALALAHLSSDALGGDSPLNLNPKDFGTDPGEIIHYLKGVSAKKAVIIRDVLNINAEAIKALHNLCDRINPLIREVIYIITMQTKNYESSQQKMAFVEKHFYHKLSKSIDKDVLTALVTRITDGAIILVQPEPNLRYC